MHDIVQILIALLELYLTVGLMLIGFGYMFAGKGGGTRVAQFYFGRSVRWTLSHVRDLVRRVLATLWFVLIHWIVRPLSRAVIRALRALLRPRHQTSHGR
jgi:hypothetical protein